MINFRKKDIDIPKKELWEQLEIAFKNENLQEFEKLISDNKEYFYSDKFRTDLVTILNTEGKFFDTKFIGALLFKISENSNKSISRIKTYIQNELGKLFQEKNNKDIEELIENIKTKLDTKNKSYLKQIKYFSEKIKNLENKLKNSEKNELKIKKENKILKNIAEEYSEIFKILIENDFLVGNNPITSVEKMIKDYKEFVKVFIKFFKDLEKENILMKNQNGGYGISPKVKSALNEINNPKKEFFFKIDINEPEEEKKSSVIKNYSHVEKYKFGNLEEKDKTDEKNSKIDKEAKMKDMKKLSEKQQKEIERLKQKMEQQQQEMEQQQEEIKKLKQEMEQLKKGEKDKHSKHKLKKAKKAYEENQ